MALGKHPYTYARVSFMRSFLLKKEEYFKLLKMNENEIASFLQASQYKKEIDELGMKFKGTELIELALNRNLANTWQKLKNISSPNLRSLITDYLLKTDIWNLKTIIRAKYTGLAEEHLQAMLIPAGILNSQKLTTMSKMETAEEILKEADFIDFRNFNKAIEFLHQKKSVSEIENALDKAYYSAMEKLSKKIPDEGKLFREFVEYELEISAIINILRLKRAGMQAKEIEQKVLIPKALKLLATRMLNSASASEAAMLLTESRFKSVSDEGAREFGEKNSLVRLELDLSKKMLKHSIALIHRHPLSVEVILGYMFAKEVEVRNLKLLLKAKQLGMDEKFAEQQLTI